MNIWFTADTHLGHQKLTTIRGFTSAADVAANIAANFNSVLKPGDVIYHLGDIGWPRFDIAGWMCSVNCKNWHFVTGNHDDDIPWTKLPNVRSISDVKYLRLDGHRVMLCHYPMASWRHSNHGGFHLHGHCHGHLEAVGRRMDVGVDTNNLQLYNWEDIRERLLAIPAPVYNHHGDPVVAAMPPASPAIGASGEVFYG